MMSIIPATPGTRRAYDHRLRDHVVRSGATSLGHRLAIPRSTISTWQRRGLRPVVTLEPFNHDPQRLLDSIARLDRHDWPRTERCLATAASLSRPAFLNLGFPHDSGTDAVAHAEVWNVGVRSWGNIAGQLAHSSPAFQAPYLREFVRELLRSFSGHYGKMGAGQACIAAVVVAAGTSYRIETPIRLRPRSLTVDR